MKRTFLIAGVILAVLLAGFLGYYFLIYRKAIPKNTVDIALPVSQNVELTAEDVRKGVTPEEKHEQVRQRLGVTAQNAVSVVKVLDKRVMHPVLAADGSRILFFDPARKKFFSIKTNGDDEQALTGATFENIADLSWSDDRTAVVLTVGKGSAARFSVLTFGDQKVTELDPRVRYPVFSPDGLRLFYLFSDTKERVNRLSFSLRDGSQPKGLRSYRGGLMQLHWFGTEDVAYGGVSSGYEAASAYAMDTRSEKNRTLVADQYALDLNFSTNGKRMAFSQARRKPSQATLLLMDTDGKNVKETGLRTLARKCAWSKEGFVLFCGVPSSPADGHVIPEDYEAGQVITYDGLYRVNAETGENQVLVVPSQFSLGYDIAEPFLSQDLSKMYFIRRNDGKLYAYLLP